MWVSASIQNTGIRLKKGSKNDSASMWQDEVVRYYERIICSRRNVMLCKEQAVIMSLMREICWAII